MRDLTLDFDGKVVNLRIVVLLKTPQGYLFERSKDGYLFPLGGRIRWGETTMEAAKRELLEEAGLRNLSLEPCGYIENFFEMKDKDCHEISFVYKSKLDKPIDVKSLESESVEENDGYILVDELSLDDYDIKPRAIIDMINSDKDFEVCVVKD